MDRICIKCGKLKPESDFRQGNRCKQCINTYKRNRRKLGLEKRYDKTKGMWTWCKNNEERKQRIKATNDKYRKSHTEINKEREAKYQKELHSRYVVRLLKKKMKLKAEIIRKYPELIESYTFQIKVIRLIKSKYENIKTP